jgi:hypothetical protein
MATATKSISSEVAVAVRAGGNGQPPAMISSWDLGATHEQIATDRAKSFGRAASRCAVRGPRTTRSPSSTLGRIHGRNLPLTPAVAMPVRLATELAATPSPGPRRHRKAAR